MGYDASSEHLSITPGLPSALRPQSDDLCFATVCGWTRGRDVLFQPHPGKRSKVVVTVVDLERKS